MISRLHYSIRALAGATLSLVVMLTTAMPGRLAAQTLPSAEQIIARYVEAIGGRDAVLGAHTARSTGTFEMPAAGLKGDLVIVTQAPDRMVSRVTIPGMGEMLSGYDGRTGWSLEPMQGARLLTGGEFDTMRENALALAQVRDASLFKSMESVELSESAGEPCYRVRLVWQSGRETLDCYHVDTGLLIATTQRSESPMGTIEVITRLTDYRAFGDVTVPSRMVIDMMGMQQVLTISSIEFENVDTSLIDPPAEIRALIK